MMRLWGNEEGKNPERERMVTRLRDEVYKLEHPGWYDTYKQK